MRECLTIGTVVPPAWARSSVVEHTLHTGGVAGSIPAAPTMPFADIAKTAMKEQASGMRGLLSFVVLGILSGTAVAADMAPKPKPAWVVEYAEKFCALVRMPDAGRPGIVIRARPLSPISNCSSLRRLAPGKKSSSVL